MYKTIQRIIRNKSEEMLARKAFTLTEVLLAVAIVGIIAALVLPVVTKHFQDKSLDASIKREKAALELAIKSVLVEENVDSYKKTALYSDNSDSTDYDSTSGVFIKRYLKVSRYCGSSNGNCFAQKYYTYDNNDKIEYTPEYKGACASLKNGASLCMTPRTPDKDLKVLIDINGKKGPNVLGKDLVEFSFALYEKGALDRNSSSVDWNNQLVVIKPACSGGEVSEDCCETNWVNACCTAFPAKYASRCNNICSKDTGNDAKCCVGDPGTSAYTSTYSRKMGCCMNNSTYFTNNKTWCCSQNPKDSRCVPEKPKDVDFEVILSCGFRYHPNMYDDMSCHYLIIEGEVGCTVAITNADKLPNLIPSYATVQLTDVNGSYAYHSASGNFTTSYGPAGTALAHIQFPGFRGVYNNAGWGGMGPGSGCSYTYSPSYYYPGSSLMLNNIMIPYYEAGRSPRPAYVSQYNTDFFTFWNDRCNKVWKCKTKQNVTTAQCSLDPSKNAPAYTGWGYPY